MPHLSDETNIENIKFMVSEINKIRLQRLTRFFLGKDWKSFMIRKDEDENIFYYFAFDKSLLYQMQSAVKKSYLNAKLDYIELENVPFPIDDKKEKKFFVGGRMNSTKHAKKRMLSFKNFHHDYLPNIINSLPANSFLKIDFQRSEKKKDLKKISGSEDLIKETQSKDRTGRQKLELRNLQHRMKGSETGFNVYISLATCSEYGYEHLKSSANAISTSLEDDASLYYRKYKDGIRKYPIFRPTLYLRDGGKLFLTGSELANLVHLPNYSDDTDLIEKLREKTDMHDKTIDLLDEGVFDNDSGVNVGYVKLSNGQKRRIKVSLKSLKDHLAITGKTGSGKSSVIVAILDGLIKEHFDDERADIASGLTFLDPGQDTALTLYNRLLKYYNAGGDIDWSKVNYMSIKNTDYPLALNLLDKNIGVNSDTSLSSIAEAISDIIESAMPSEAPVAKRLLSKCIETLLADDEVHTILDVKLLVKNTTYRNQIIRRIKNNPANYEIVEYWETDAEENLKTSETALMNRLEVFTSSPVLKRMFGQPHAEMQFRKILDEGHIYLFDMTGLSQAEMRIIGGYLSYRFYKASVGRPRNSRLHILGFDETKVLGKMPYLTNIIAETRKFNLAGLVGAQMFSQLDNKLKTNLKDVQDNFISCLQGSSESKEVAGFLSDKRVEIAPKDLERLNPKLRESYIALKDEVNGQTERYTMKVQVDAPVKYGMNGQIVPYESREEEEAVNTTLLIANMRRKFKEGVKHKYEVDLDIIKKMNFDKDLSHLKITDLKRMTEDEKRLLEEEIEELNQIRNNEILPVQIPIFYRQDQEEHVEEPRVNEKIESTNEESSDIEEDQNTTDEFRLPLTLIEDTTIKQPGKALKTTDKSKTNNKKVVVNKNGFFSIDDFIEAPIEEAKSIKDIETNKKREIDMMELDSNEETSQHRNKPPNLDKGDNKSDVEVTSTNKKPRNRRKLSDMK
ncbi:TPA: DUF87 domain-containing protein [Staphylococcus aureus]|nr:DUF87 domain-containing protein [Staphylococcus aureus]